MKYLTIFLLFLITSFTSKKFDGVYVYSDKSGWQLTSRTLKIENNKFRIYGGGHAGYDFYGFGEIIASDTTLILIYTKLISTLEYPKREIERLKIVSSDSLVIEDYVPSEKDFNQGYKEKREYVDRIYKLNKKRNRLKKDTSTYF